MALTAARCVSESSARCPNLLALAGYALQALFAVRHQTAEDYRCGVIRRFRLPAEGVADHLRGNPRFQANEIRELFDIVTEWWGPLAASDKQYLGVLGTARTVFTAFSDPAPSRTLKFGCEPGDGSATIDFGTAADAEDRRTVYLFRAACPARTRWLRGRSKACYFESILDSPNAGRRAAKCPWPRTSLTSSTGS